MSSPLHALQAEMQSFVLGAEPASPTLLAAIVQQTGLPAEARLDIYHHAYRARLVEALGLGHENVRALLGAEEFDRLAFGYAESHPSPFSNLRWYGAELADWLEQAGPEYAVAAELARFEWALGLAFDAPDHPPLAAQDLAGLAAEDWGGIGFSLHPSVHLLTLRTNVDVLWQGLNEDDAHPPQPQLAEEPVCWLVWRQGLESKFRPVTRPEAEALEQLSCGVSFAEVCEAAAQQADGQEGDGTDATPQIAGWLQTWLKHGILGGFALADAEERID